MTYPQCLIIHVMLYYTYWFVPLFLPLFMLIRQNMIKRDKIMNLVVSIDSRYDET